MRGMQRLDNAVCISTEAENVMFGLGSDFLQDKCSWQGSMGRAFLTALVSRGHQGPSELFQISYQDSDIGRVGICNPGATTCPEGCI